MDSSPPLLHCHEGVATITLNRPAQRNRLENGDLQTLLQHVAQINEDLHIRAVVLTDAQVGAREVEKAVEDVFQYFGAPAIALGQSAGITFVAKSGLTGQVIEPLNIACRRALGGKHL